MIDVHHIEQISQDCSLTEFVGTTVLDTIGLVIPGIDPSLLETKLSSQRTQRLFPSSFLVIQKAGADTDVSS